MYKAIIDDLCNALTKRCPTKTGVTLLTQSQNPPTPAPAQPTETTTPQPVAFKVYDAAGKQIGAYNVEVNAYRSYVDNTATRFYQTGNYWRYCRPLSLNILLHPLTVTPPEQGGGQPVAEKWTTQKKTTIF